MKPDNTIGYKFLRTDRNFDCIGYTRKTNATVEWKLGQWVETDFGRSQPYTSPRLCTSQALHYFRTPLMAFLNRGKVGYNIPMLVFCKVEIGGPYRHERGLKAGTTRMRVTEVIPMPSEEDLKEVRQSMMIGYYPRLTMRQKTDIWNKFWIDHNRPDLVSAKL